MTDDFIATLARKRMGAAALLTDGQDRVLLVEPCVRLVSDHRRCSTVRTA